MRTNSLQEFERAAIQFTHLIQPRTDAATLVTFSGDLGAGKTTFVQTVATEFGVTEDVTSPTFVIEKIYPLSGQKFARLIHIDAYRLESSHELEVLGFMELLHDPNDLVLLEWPEKVPELIPENAMNIRFDIHGDQRTISFNGKENLEETGR
jgi:tRNA threonylcarbamoyladenosine biosynthesis protein TsaE